jgi:peptidoglycan/xylan/chitin deacetylase (PgdA/CDA1 family)
MKRVKLGILRLLKTLGLFALARRWTRGGVRILCFHGVWLGQEGYRGDAMFMNPATFRDRIALLARLGYPVISLDRAVAGLTAGDLPPGAVAITIDDGWYSTYAAMLPVLFDHGLPATLYVDSQHLLTRKPVAHMMARYLEMLGRRNPAGATLGYGGPEEALPIDERLAAARASAEAAGLPVERYLADGVFDYMLPEQLAEAHAKGLDVQLHTHRHTLHDLSASAIRSEIVDNRRALGEILGRDPDSFRHFCYPSGRTSAEAGTVLRAERVASSTTTVQGIARRGMDLQYLPRIQDGEQVTPIEFEAELCGMMDLLRGTARRVRGRA